MANVIVEEQSLIDIANSIRTKNGTSNTYKPSEMASAIESITGGSSEDLSNELTTQNTLLSSQTNKLNDVINALVGKAIGGGSSKTYTGGTIGFVEDGDNYIGFLSFSPDVELADGEIYKINFANFMELMTSDELTTVSEDIVLHYNSRFDNYSASVDVDLSQFGYGICTMIVTINPELGAAMITYSSSDTPDGPLNIGIWLEQTGRVADV